MSRFAVLATIALVLFAWTVPVVAESLQPAAEIWQTANRPWLSIKDRFSFAFASLRASVGLVSDYYGDSLLLGRGNALSDRIVFEVETGTFSFVGARFYWRARTYDEYRDAQWLNNITDFEITSIVWIWLSQVEISSHAAYNPSTQCNFHDDRSPQPLE
jgi:hypothetical protein